VRKALAHWFWEFFITDTLAQIPENVDSPLPLPSSQRLHIASSFRNRLSQAIRATPKALLQFASPRLQTGPEKRTRIKVNRTLSQTTEINVKAFHARSRSSAVHSLAVEIEQKDAGNKCFICRRMEANTVLDECGCEGMCERCAEIVMNTKKVCPVCGKEIKGVGKIIRKKKGSEDCGMINKTGNT
jgi:hypothetical protein